MVFGLGVLFGNCIDHLVCNVIPAFNAICSYLSTAIKVLESVGFANELFLYLTIHDRAIILICCNHLLQLYLHSAYISQPCSNY